jgi:hypothetical protein
VFWAAIVLAPIQPQTRAWPPSTGGAASVFLAHDSLHSVFEQYCRNLHRACVRLFGELLKMFKSPRREPDQALLAPRWIRGAPAAFRDAETRGDFGR